MYVSVCHLYKNLFLRRKQIDHVRHLILTRSEKGELNATKKLLPTICRELLLNLQCYLEYQTVKVEKFSQQTVLSLASWKTDKYSNRQKTPREIKLKSNENRLMKFYEVKQSIKIQPENSAENITLQKTQLRLNEN